MIKKILLIQFLLLMAIPSFAWEISFIPTLSSKNLEIEQTYQAVTWLLKSLVVLVCIIFGYLSSKAFADEKYYQGLMGLISSIIVGISPYLAQAFIY